MTTQHDSRPIGLHSELTMVIREETGLHEDLASQVAERVVRGLQRRRGGDELYIPKTSAAVSHEDIRRAFTGRNREEVCRRFGISRATFYRAIQATGS